MSRKKKKSKKDYYYGSMMKVSNKKKSSSDKSSGGAGKGQEGDSGKGAKGMISESSKPYGKSGTMYTGGAMGKLEYDISSSEKSGKDGKGRNVKTSIAEGESGNRLLKTGGLKPTAAPTMAPSDCPEPYEDPSDDGRSRNDMMTKQPSNEAGMMASLRSKQNGGDRRKQRI